MTVSPATEGSRCGSGLWLYRLLERRVVICAQRSEIGLAEFMATASRSAFWLWKSRWEQERTFLRSLLSLLLALRERGRSQCSDDYKAREQVAAGAAAVGTAVLWFDPFDALGGTVSSTDS